MTFAGSTSAGRRIAGHAPTEFVCHPERLVERTDVMESAPPTAAAKQATVVRSMFTHGSFLLIIRHEVTALSRIARAGSEARRPRRGAPTSCAAQLADAKELVAGQHGVGEQDPSACLVDAETGRRQRLVGDGCRHRDRQILALRGSGVVVGRGIDPRR